MLMETWSMNSTTLIFAGRLVFNVLISGFLMIVTAYKSGTFSQIVAAYN
jgi:hypothetical protein